MFSNLIAQQNLPLTVADEFRTLRQLRTIDRPGTTKSTKIIKNAIAPQLDKDVQEKCQINTFGSFAMKVLRVEAEERTVILVRIFVTTKFIDMPICNAGTAVNLSIPIDEVLSKRNIPWSNVVGYGSDNANDIVGRKSSFLSDVNEKEPLLIDLGFICHITNLCVIDGVKALYVPVEDLLVDVYYHFKHSAKCSRSSMHSLRLNPVSS